MRKERFCEVKTADSGAVCQRHTFSAVGFSRRGMREGSRKPQSGGVIRIIEDKGQKDEYVSKAGNRSNPAEESPGFTGQDAG